ncbi:MAG: DUF2889 domain-containing protein [Castellaniella sp.]
MPLPAPDAAREPVHTRTITVNAFARQDGQWDLEAELVDVKAYDFDKSDGSVHGAGSPIHHMHLRITIDAEYTITGAVAAYDAAPFGAQCSAIAPDYADLVGMNLLRGFRHAVRQRFARMAGCTHLTELCNVFPTVAVQTMAARRREERARPGVEAKRPFQIDGCHALRADGPVVRRAYPEWYTGPQDSPDDG